MATELELIALEQLRKQLSKISTRIAENEDTPERQVQYVLPFMKTELMKAFEIINAIENNNSK